MKKTALVFVLLGLTAASCLYAQKNEGQNKYNQLGITFSAFGNNDLVYFQSLEGAASYNADKFFTIGINYLHQLNKTFDIETAFEYSKHYITIEPNVPPDMDDTPYGAEFSLINIPVTIRANFLRYCFVNGGLLLGIDPTVSGPVDSQSGIGAIIGLGLKYDSKSGVSVFVNPYGKVHSLISFSNDDHQQHLLESGFRFGIMYRLK